MRAISPEGLPHDRNLTRAEAIALIGCDLASLMRAAAGRRDAAHGANVSYSRKVFIPLTKLCRDVCHYCTFAHPPRNEPAYLSLDQVLAIARAGQAARCKEALFTLGDQPELRYRAAANELGRLGHHTTLSYLEESARVVLAETGLLPHLNPGHLDARDLAALRAVSVSQGLMLESASERLARRGGPHHGSPDKHPRTRLASIRAAGEAHVPFTTGSGSARRRRSASTRFWRCARCTRRTGTSRKSSSRISARSPEPAWPMRRRPRSRSTCGRSRSRASCSRPR
jgi:FO synthase